MNESPESLTELVARGTLERAAVARAWRSAEFTIRESASDAGSALARSISRARWAGALFAVGALLLRFKKLRRGFRWARWILRFAPPLASRLHLFGRGDSKQRE